MGPSRKCDVSEQVHKCANVRRLLHDKRTDSSNIHPSRFFFFFGLYVFFFIIIIIFFGGGESCRALCSPLLPPPFPSMKEREAESVHARRAFGKTATNKHKSNEEDG